MSSSTGTTSVALDLGTTTDARVSGGVVTADALYVPAPPHGPAASTDGFGHPLPVTSSDSIDELLRRTFDVICAVIALVLGAPVMLLLAAIIRLDSPGPALFRQQRIGRGGRPFTFYKFRTLYSDARQRFPELYAYRYSPTEIESLCFKLKNDRRVTRVGRWLRKSTLDEIPNFINVLTGDMALVGPRPEIPEMLPYYRREDRCKFQVRPGVTGLAQTSGRGDLSFRDTVRYDVQYVHERTLRLDVVILAKTVVQAITRKGAF